MITRRWTRWHASEVGAVSLAVHFQGKRAPVRAVWVLMVAFSIRGTTFGHGGGLLSERTEGRERAGDDDYVHFSPEYSQMTRGEMDV